MEMYIVNESSVIRGSLTYDYEDDDDDDDDDEDENVTAARQLELTVNKIVPKAVIKTDSSFVDKFNKVLDGNSGGKSTNKPFDISEIWKPSVLINIPPNSKSTTTITTTDPNLIGTVRLLEDPTKSSLRFLHRLENILDPKNLSIKLEVPLNRDRDNSYLICSNLTWDSSGIWKEDSVNLPSAILRIGLNPYGDYFSGRLTIILSLNQSAVHQVENIYCDILYSAGGPSGDTTELNRKLLESGVISDLGILAGNGQLIKCHRAFLALSSPVFRAMFESGMKESKMDGCLEMGEISEEGVRSLLTWLYCREIDKMILRSSDKAVELLEIAHKYDIEELVVEIKNLLILKPVSWYSEDAAGKLADFLEKIDDMVELKEKINCLVVNSV